MDKSIFETGLKCDNIRCDWVDKTIPSKEHKKWINKPCPKCGENVLTKKDYYTFQFIKFLCIFIIHPADRFFTTFIPKKKRKYYSVGIDVHDKESGRMKITTEIMLTSEEWNNKLFPNKEVIVLDPDGWDRKNFQYSWYEERISKETFMLRILNSTCRMNKI